MKDGTKIKVDDMTESHAKNCLKLLMRRNNANTFRLDAPEDLIEGVMAEWENEFWNDEYRYGSSKT